MLYVFARLIRSGKHGLENRVYGGGSGERPQAFAQLDSSSAKEFIGTVARIVVVRTGFERRNRAIHDALHLLEALVSSLPYRDESAEWSRSVEDS